MPLSRPGIIWALSVFFIIFPVVLLFFDRSHEVYISLPLYFIIATGIFFVRKWGWYSSLCAACILFLINTLVLWQQPWPKGLFLLGINIIIVFTGFVLFHKELMAPYFFPRLRWWESEERIRTQLYGHLRFGDMLYHGEISDISLSGCFVELTIRLGDMDTRHKPVLTIQLRSKVLTLPILVMRVIRDGYGAGCMFSANALYFRGQIENMIRELIKSDPDALEMKSLAEERYIRAKTGLKGFVIIHGISYPVRVLDLSRHGAGIIVKEDVAELLDLNLFHLEFHGIVIEVEVKIRHVHHQENAFIIGLEIFHTLQSRILIHRLIMSLKRAGYETVVRQGNPGDVEGTQNISRLFPFTGK